MKRGRPSNKKPPDTTKKKRPQRCIIHKSSIPLSDHLIFLCDLPDGANRFNGLKELKQLRLKQPLGSANRREEACSRMPEEASPEDGYHRSCYVDFTCKLLYTYINQ